VVYVAAKNLVKLIFVGFEKTLPGCDQHLPAKCSVFPLPFGAEHCQSLETALPNVGKHYLTVDLSRIEFCKDGAF
jgi:hypothetical protein